MYNFSKKKLVENDIIKKIVLFNSEKVEPKYNNGCPSGRPSGKNITACDQNTVNEGC